MTRSPPGGRDEPRAKHLQGASVAPRRERAVRVEAAEGTPFDFGRFEIVEEDWPSDELAQAHLVAQGQAHWLLD